MLPTRWSAPALVCTVLFVSACGDAKPLAALDVAAPDQTSEQDAGELSDDRDAGLASATSDAGGAEVDAGAAAEPVVTPVAQPCVLKPEELRLVANTFVSPEDALALSVRNDGAMLTFVAYEGGKRKVTPTWFSADMTSTAGGALSGTSDQVDPSSTATRTGFMTVWSDDQTGSFKLFAQVNDPDGERAGDGSPIRLTQGDDDDRAPVVASGANDDVLVAWRAELATDQGRTLLIDAKGAPQGEINDIAGFGATIGRPSLVRFSEGYLLAWVDEASRQVRLQRLDSKGAPLGAFVRADTDGSAEGHLDLTTTDEGGAIAFDVRVAGQQAEIRFRTFDRTGRLLGSEQALNQHAERGLAPSIAAFRGGYVVAYRSLTDGETALHVAFVDAQGERISSIDLAALGDLSLPTVLRASPDGLSLFVAWTDRVEDTGAYQLTRTWLHCD